MHFQRVTLDYVRNALPGLLGAVGIKLDAVAKQLGAAGDCLESHAIADAGVYCRRGLIGKQEKPSNPAGLRQWKRVETESTFALKAQGGSFLRRMRTFIVDD
jgi:hypothetical protein